MAQKPLRLPAIKANEPFGGLVEKLAKVFTDLVDKPTSFEEFRTTHDYILRPLVRHLHRNVHHPALVAAILALKGHFVALESEDEQGIHAARGFACEAVALKFVVNLADREVIDSLLYELPAPSSDPPDNATGTGQATPTSLLNEDSPLLSRSYHSIVSSCGLDGSAEESTADSSGMAAQFEGLNALEVAAVAGAKKFLSQKPIQRIVNAIWKGDIIFWANLSPGAIKRAQIYQRKSIDPYSRLRVPMYLKAFEVLFFFIFLALYYIVLVQRSFHTVTVAEILLYIWIASFAYNEIGEFCDAGTAFYLSDFWSAWDIGIVAIGGAFFIARMTGLAKGSDKIIDTSFDILALEALFLIPRTCSLLSLHEYFGVLIPSLSAMTKDFIKFLSLIIILYLGFLTTFCLLARGYFSFRQMCLILTKVFFGSSYLGFDVAEKISPILGLPLMLVFIILTNILLVTSLISILSNTLTKVTEHARDEYLFVYSVFVLEASTSNRLTYFIPPLNLISLAFRPLRLVVSAGKLRNTRIILLKLTHFPHVVAISVYERVRLSLNAGKPNDLGLGSPRGTERPSAWRKSALNNRISMPYPLATVGRKHGSSLEDDPHNQADATREDTSAASTKEIKMTLDQLTTQIEALRKMMEQQERQVQVDD
ncbi:hypothetical protein MBLNU459_g7389t1 [Dothideomycetes sp. NU459]